MAGRTLWLALGGRPCPAKPPGDQDREPGSGEGVAGEDVIDGPELQRILRQARADTIQLMDRLLASGDLEDHQRHALENADTTTEFVRLAKRVGVAFRRVEATWPWPGRSVADAVGAHPPDVVRWLAIWSYKTCVRALAWSMEQAWHQAFDHHAPDAWVMIASGVQLPM